MPEITSPQVVEFCNGYLRPLSDSLAHLHAIIPSVVAVYNQRGIYDKIEAVGAGNLITDGSEADGRTRRNGGHVYSLVTILSELHTFLAANNRPDVFNGWQVNGVKPGTGK